MASFVPSPVQLLIILLMVVSIHCVTFYSELQSIEGLTTSSMWILSEHDLKTERTMCARLCTRNGNCASYFENSETKQCRLVRGLLGSDSGNLTNAPGWGYYARAVCDVDKGYVYDRQSSLCLKYFKERIAIPAARLRCAHDGGRLLEIRNQHQQVVLATYLDNVGATGRYGPTIAGKKHTTTWLFEDGTPMTYLNWDQIKNPPEPLATYYRHCIRVKLSGNHHWASAICGRREPFLCQVP